MIIRFTQKLAKKLKIGSLDETNDDPGPFLEWYAHLFTADRTQYILTTEAKSLLSVVFYGRGITDDTEFLSHWLSYTREYLAEIGKSFVFKNFIGPNTDHFIYAKTQSKSILGSMNDMISVSKVMIPIRDMSPWDVSRMINETPFKAIGYKRPFDAFNDLKKLKMI